MLGKMGVIIATGQTHRQGQLGPDSGTAGHHGMNQGLPKARRSLRMGSLFQAGLEHALYSFD
jgi:hypothetical protein